MTIRAITSAVNDILRNPYRVFNHQDLISEKLATGKKWGLVGDDSNKTMHLQVFKQLEQLVGGKADVSHIICQISEIAGKPVADLQADLLKVYKTGLLELHITDRCDLNCIDCYYDHKTGATIEFDAVRAIVELQKPKAVTITGGGEPNVYRSGANDMGDVIEMISTAVPGISVGIINNNTRIVAGSWPRLVQWQRSSVDAGSAQTYLKIKGVDAYETVNNNVKDLLLKADIPYVGVGYLLRSENVHEVSSFLTSWYQWLWQQTDEVQAKFNVQFRTIAPSVNKMEEYRSKKSFLSTETIVAFKAEMQSIQKQAIEDPEFDLFLKSVTNFYSYLPLINSDDPFIHEPKAFKRCYNALIHRVTRANGDEYPDFLLVGRPNYKMGNIITDGIEGQYKTALMQYYFYNRGSEFCSPECCRQSWVNATVENPDAYEKEHRPAQNYFF